MRAYKNYLLSVLLVILAFNYVDRLALGLLMQDIKADLGLTDTQLGLLGGIAFAVFYAVMGIPIARWADRGNRVTIIALTTALWSAAVALCGLAGSFVHLIWIRIGVAVGEAGCIPPAHSLIADHFRREERPRAVAIYMLGAPLSVVIGYFLAGWLNEFYGWRATFVLLGLPGLALAVLARLTLREPRFRGQAEGPGGSPSSTSVTAEIESTAKPPVQPPLREIWVTLWRSATFRHLLIGYALASFFGYGILQWKPAFFLRSFNLQTGELGTWLALISGLGGLLGTYWGGELASRYAANNERLQLRAMALAYCGFGTISACIYLSVSLHLALGLLALATIGITTITGPLFAVIQTLVPAHMRATSFAIIYLFANFVGMGLGPLAAGVLSDAFRPLVGQESLRWALLVLCPGYLWCAWHLWQASRTVTEDVDLQLTKHACRVDPLIRTDTKHHASLSTDSSCPDKSRT